MLAFVYPSNLAVKSKKTAQEFLDCIKEKQIIDIKDVNGKGCFSFMRDDCGEIRIGYGQYGKDPIIAPPITMDKELVDRAGKKYNAVELAFASRKSINAYLKGRR